MGAGCSNGRALAVKDSVTKKITLTPESLEHLKTYQQAVSGVEVGGIEILATKKTVGVSESINASMSKEDSRVNASPLRKMASISHQMLWEAVETNDINLAEGLLEKISSEQLQLSEADLYDNLGNSMAHKAASLGHAEILMLLLERTGAKPDIANAQLSTPLHLACKNNRDSVAKFLIGCGVDVNGQDEHGQSPLLICCIHGNYDLAQLIIESSSAGHTPEPLDIDMRDHRGLTPLNCAAIKGDMKLAKLLIEKASASVEIASPKGCTPVIYAARGGYEELLHYLIIQCKASTLKQDNSGATLFHHAIEKSQLDILKMLLRVGNDIISAVEIADNAGRTPLFEAIDNNAPVELVRLLLQKRVKKGTDGGFGMNANVINYNGQTPLFSAVREANMELIKTLVEFGGADPDLNGGEMVKDDSDDAQNMLEDEFESEEERNFMEAYKNCTNPLHLACILGYDEIATYLTERAQANPNLQTNIKGYGCLHLAVLANKPEMIIELLTRTNANPNLPDYSGRTFIEMVELYIPTYFDHFTAFLENLQVERLKRADTDSAKNLQVATHYYNPDDEREIKGFKDPQVELEKHIEELQQQDHIQVQNNDTEPEDGQVSGQGEIGAPKAMSQKKFMEMDDSEIEVEEGKVYERDIEIVFGRKIALGLIAVNFKFKEIAMKIIIKHAEKLLNPNNQNDSSFNINEFVKACTISVDLTCKEKVIKVFNICLQLLTLLITSPKVEQSSLAMETFKRLFTERSITLKLLQRSEEGNTRLTNKIHECLLDYSFHPRIGEAHVSSFILQRINSHNKSAVVSANAQKAQLDSRNAPSIEGGALGSYKGLLAQLALLYKFVNSFGVSARKRGPLNSSDIVNAILPSLTHSSQDVRSASTKILLDVQRLSGAVKEETLSQIPEKQRNVLLEKLRAQVIEREQNQEMINNISKEYEGSESQPESQDDLNAGANSSRIKENDQEDQGKGAGLANWTGSKDQSLKNVLDFLNESKKASQLTEEFLTNATVLIKSCLEDNNFNMYLQALDVATVFFQKALFTEPVLGSLQSLVKPIVLRTTDTNTRIRKRSVEILYQIWQQQPPTNMPKFTSQGASSGDQSQNSVPQIIADVICDQSLQERAIIGRLGLFIKRATMIDGVSEDELSKKPHQVIMGRNYEQLTEFASLWCTHKNTKVRQNALKLIVEICRLNSIDPRGHPFKQRIINMILHLRASLRDPLVQKINEMCSLNGSGQYIDVNELELNLATKSSNKRAASMDVRISKARPSSKNGGGSQGSALPEIGGGARNRGSENALPSLGTGAISLSAVAPQVLLPHSEPLTDEQKTKAANLIDLFSLELVTCFYSQFWFNRLASIEKVEEQLHNLDPNRRDAMSCEINRKNLPIEEIFKIFLEFIEEGSKDPVLKNLVSIVDLLKKALPTFFRYIQSATIRKELMPFVSSMIKKTTDLKAKVRDVTIDFCLYLSHQSVIGPEIMVNQVLQELELVLNDQPSTNNSSNVATNMGNSHMISSCFKLLNSFQQQAKILDKTLKTFPAQPQMYLRFIALINASLKHQNPTVRKEGETLFKTLYAEFGERLDNLLTGQKAQVVSKLLQEAKSENGLVDGNLQQEQNVQRAQTQIRTEMITSSTLGQLLKGQEENLNALKLPNAKKRIAAVVELRKAVQKELVSVQGNPQVARNLFEPLSMLIRQLLSDEEPEIYMETLGMLRAVVGALVPHMSTLDVHLMLGSFIGVIVANTVSGNIRTQIASDKVIIFFAKHSNIGPFVVAKDILKNIEKCIKAVQVITKREEQIACLQEKKPTILRFLSILQLLLQHFSIVLCYQTEFYDKCIDIIADSMISLAADDQSIKNLCVSLIVSLQKIDAKLLEQAISKMDFSKKTPLRKAMIELEHQSRAGKNVLTQDHHAFANQSSAGARGSGGVSGGNMVPASPMATNGNNRDTRGSNMTGSSRTSLFSPGTTLRGASPSINGMGMTTHEWGRKSIEGGFTPQNLNGQQPSYVPTGVQMMNSTQGSAFQGSDSRAMRRMISLENENPRGSQNNFAAALGSTPLNNQPRGSMKMFKEDGMGSVTPGSTAKKELVLPDIVAPITTLQPLSSATNMNYNQRLNNNAAGVGMNVAPKMSLHATGGAGFNSNSTYTGPVLKPQNSTDSNANINNNGVIRPPLYVPQKRDGGRSGTGTGIMSGSGIGNAGLPNNGQPISLLNRTGPLPSTYQPPNENQQVQPSGQFKTEFNSNLYSGLPGPISSGASTSGTSSTAPRSSSLQQPPRKSQMPALGTASIFKGVPPQPVATFETNITKYTDSGKAAEAKGLFQQCDYIQKAIQNA